MHNICIKEDMKTIWDLNKAASNLKLHRVSFISAVSVLSDDLAITIEDYDHGEQRFIAIGMGVDFRILVVVYSYQDESTIRIISARRAEPHERSAYEN